MLFRSVSQSRYGVSETWDWERDVTNPSVSDISYEGERLRDYLMQRVSDYLLYLFRIDW